MADRANIIVNQIAMGIDGWNWGMDLWNVIELLVVTLSMGFVLGYTCAIKSARVKAIPVDTKADEKSTSNNETRSKGASHDGPAESKGDAAVLPLGLGPEAVRCPVCELWLPNQADFESHLKGEKHRRRARRSIGTQSQCTYKRKLVTPRFHALSPCESADGVFDVSFSD